MINQFQLLLLLPLTSAYLHPDVVKFCTGFEFSLASMNFIPKEQTPILGSKLDVFDYAQNNDYLYDISFESGSTPVNMLSLFLFNLSIIPFHVVVFLIYK